MMRIDLRRAFWSIFRSPSALISLIVLMILAICAIFAPLLAPFDPLKTDLSNKLAGPDGQHVFGTDELGRDILSRILFGLRYSLGIAIIVVIIAAIVGTLFGLLAAYYGGIVDLVMMRIVDIMLAFPSIILSLVIVGLFGGGAFNLILALAATQWPSYSRLVRSTVLSLKTTGYVENAKVLRAPTHWIIGRHILPNAQGPIIVLIALDIGHTILFAAAISFLGLGIQPPTPELGLMIRSGVRYLTTAPHVALFPGLFLSIIVLAFNFLSDWVKECLHIGRDLLMEVES
ncbi:MAG: ABC transporter permease [Methanomassiliicoccales archaeon]|nr:ABC transporter permease [Methanomassiliicoccales archaeon]